MKQEIIDLAKYRLEKAGNTLSDARRYANDATLESTVNRIYYAMFYAVCIIDNKRIIIFQIFRSSRPFQ